MATLNKERYTFYVIFLFAPNSTDTNMYMWTQTFFTFVFSMKEDQSQWKKLNRVQTVEYFKVFLDAVEMQIYWEISMKIAGILLK